MMATGKHKLPRVTIEVCGTSCAIYTGELNKFFIPVYANNVVEFFESSTDAITHNTQLFDGSIADGGILG